MLSVGAGRVLRLNASDGGVPKRAVERARVTVDGLLGDSQRDRRHHGGPERALCLWSAERIEALVAEGHPVSPGSTGENVTVTGLDWSAVGPGARLVFAGGVELAVTDYATPCATIRDSFAGARFERIHQQRHPGWSRVYARVLVPGELRRGEALELRAPEA